MTLVPDTFAVPEQYEANDLLFRKLCYADAEADYKAVMSSIDLIRKIRGGEWPAPGLTIEDNKIDLGWHQREFEFRLSFAYAVLSLDGQEHLGCVYMYPPGFLNELPEGVDVDASMWITQAAYDRGLYPVLYKTFDSWLRSTWPFKNIAYTNKVLPE